MKTPGLYVLCLACAALLAGCAPPSAEPPADEGEIPVVVASAGPQDEGDEVRAEEVQGPLAETIALYGEYCSEIQSRFPGFELDHTEAEDFEAMLSEAEREEARLELGERLNQAITAVTQRVFLYMENYRKMGNGELEGAQAFLDEYAKKFEEVDWASQG